MPEAVRQPLIEFTAKDCGQNVYECPQSEWRQQQNETWGNLLRGRTERIDFSRGGERVTRAEVSELIHSFPRALRLFLRQRPDEEFDLHQIEQVLQDCVDLIRETAEVGRASSSATLENTITGVCSVCACQHDINLNIPGKPAHDR